MGSYFVSYASEDQQHALALAAALERAGDTCWYYQRDSVPGEAHLITTYGAITKHKNFVVLVSRAALASNYVLLELLAARASQVRYFPVFVGMSYAELEQADTRWVQALGYAAAMEWDAPEVVVERIRKAQVKSHTHATGTQPSHRRSQRLPLQTALRLQAWSMMRARGLRMRFVGSVFMRIRAHNKYFLVYNPHRPETFSPFGGVIKALPGTWPLTERFQYEPDIVGKPGEVLGDVRGYVPARHALGLARWFMRGEGRETAPAAAVRELGEEFVEAGLDPRDWMTAIAATPMQKLHTVFEPPIFGNARTEWQFRIFEVWELGDSAALAPMFDALQAAAQAEKTIIAVTREEVALGRSNSTRLIGAVSNYLFEPRRLMGDVPIVKT